MKKLNINIMKNIANDRKGFCLSNKYIDASTKLKWQCSEGHIWKSKPLNVKHGSWCPICAYRKQAINIIDIKKIARIRGGKCLSTECINGNSILKMQCSKGHIWETKATNIRHGTWCPICAKEKRRNQISNKLSIYDMYQLAKEHGGIYLSKKYINVVTKIAWKCAYGHIWDTTPYSIKRGAWCPFCASNKIKAESVRKLNKVAIAKGGKYLTEYVSARKKIKIQCSAGHIWEILPYNIMRGGWCPYCSKHKHLTINDMQKFAKQKGGKCLSKKYLNIRSKLLWQCSFGHTWLATPNHIRNMNSWCPICFRNKIYH